MKIEERALRKRQDKEFNKSKAEDALKVSFNNFYISIQFGSGKSYVIDAIKNLLKERCRVCSFFGIAAFNVNGKTLHSLLQLPIKGKRNGALKSVALAKLQNDFQKIEYLIIDEFSVTGQKMFAWIN